MAEVIGLLQLLLTALPLWKDTVRERQKGAGLFKPSLLSEIHERLQRLQVDVRRMRELLSHFAPDNRNFVTVTTGPYGPLTEAVTAFYGDLERLSAYIMSTDVNVLRMYDPDVMELIETAYVADIKTVTYLEENWADTQGSRNRRLVKDVQEVHNRLIDLGIESRESKELTILSTLTGSRDVGGHSHRGLSEHERAERVLTRITDSREEFEKQLLVLERLLKQCSDSLASFVRANWTPKDLS